MIVKRKPPPPYWRGGKQGRLCLKSPFFFSKFPKRWCHGDSSALFEFPFPAFLLLAIQEILDHINKMYWRNAKCVTPLHQRLKCRAIWADIRYVSNNTLDIARLGIDIGGNSIGDISSISYGMHFSNHFVGNLLRLRIVVCDRVFHKRLVMRHIVLIHDNSLSLIKHKHGNSNLIQARDHADATSYSQIKTVRGRSLEIYMSMPRLVILLMWELIFGTAGDVTISVSLNGRLITTRTGSYCKKHLQTSGIIWEDTMSNSCNTFHRIFVTENITN